MFQKDAEKFKWKISVKQKNPKNISFPLKNFIPSFFDKIMVEKSLWKFKETKKQLLAFKRRHLKALANFNL